MRKTMFLVTHGDREYGVDPEMTDKGREQVLGLASYLPKGISSVVVGTGKRHLNVCVLMMAGSNLGLNIPIWTSPFCGSADSLNADKETVTLADGRVVKLRDYEGLGFCFDAWSFVAKHPDRTLFCAGGELMLALNQKSEKGCLYELNVEEKTARKIQ